MKERHIFFRRSGGKILDAIFTAFRGDGPTSHFNRVMIISVTSLLTVDIIFSALLRLGALQQLRAVAALFVASPGMLLLIGACYYCRWRGGGLNKMGDISQLLAWSLLVISSISFLIPIAGRTPCTLVDVGLNRIDASLHFQTATYVAFVARLPWLRRILGLAYNFLPPLIAAALILPSICGKVADSRRFVLAVLVAAIFTALGFALWPAAGPWTVQRFAPTEDQAKVAQTLAFLKSGQPLSDNLKDSGVVAFPSFHVVLALLSVLALRNIRWVGWVGAAIGTLICISTITTGWHYGIDVIGGLAVVYLSQSTANFVMPLASLSARTLSSVESSAASAATPDTVR